MVILHRQVFGVQEEGFEGSGLILCGVSSESVMHLSCDKIPVVQGSIDQGVFLCVFISVTTDGLQGGILLWF